MPGLATNADVTAGNGPADGLMAYPDQGCAFVDLVRKAGGLRVGTNEVGVDCFHTHRLPPTFTGFKSHPGTTFSALFTKPLQN